MNSFFEFLFIFYCTYIPGTSIDVSLKILRRVLVPVQQAHLPLMYTTYGFGSPATGYWYLLL